MGGGFKRLLLPLLALSGLANAFTKDDDLITDLPGLTFTPNFKQYSGFLDASVGNHLHYWLVEAQNDPNWAPLVLWLNGGPGCSSLGGFFTELGPFHPTADGQNLVENVHTWNKAANVLFLEAPRDVGYSYRDNATYGYDTLYNDDKTATDNALALISFFARFPEYRNRPFFITGESYGGVYVPTLTNLIIKMIQNGTIPYVNLAGMGVGNGELSAYQQINSAIDLLYFRGMLGKHEFDDLAQCCTDDYGQSLTYCDFSQFVTVDDFGNLNPKNYPQDATKNNCAKKVVQYAQNAVWESTNDVYNSYQDCYDYSPLKQSLSGVAGRRTYKAIMGSKTMRASVMNSDVAAFFTSASSSPGFLDYGSKLNVNSTDAVQSFPCYMDDATEFYLNRKDVRKALHIPDNVQYWTDCNIPINENFYHQQNHDTTPVFQSIISSNYPLRILIYNGDVDMACNFQGDEWFIDALATNMNLVAVGNRQEWTYTRSGFDTVVAGFAQRWTSNSTVIIDQLTVKGGGHFVPTDRPAPALQMIFNFLYNRDSYNNTIPWSLDPKPLLASAPQPTPLSRKQQDRVWSLPGLTYNLNFRQYSGYLSGVPGNSLHYWLVESQSNPSSDPLVLWLNGGPGCSSLMGLLSELGPFHPNPDGKTLFENTYSWNKGANILFIESPRNVGFSVQDTSINNDNIYNDEKTAKDVYLALKDFISAYPEYIGRPFYVTGESYGGVYVPTLTSLLIDEIQAGNFPQLNLVGMAVGNGELSALQQINSVIHMLYFHGLYGKQEWDQLQQCCDNTTGDPKWFEYCDFTKYIKLSSSGDAYPIDPTGVCGPLVVSMGQARVWNTINDVYNIYQDCYQQTTDVFGSMAKHSQLKNVFKRKLFAASFLDQGAQISQVSTDNQGGFDCYASDAASQYLNSNDVKSALHINPTAGNWSSCNDDINANYVQQHNDTGKVFDHIIQSGYPLRMMIYNGDVDMACNFLGDQWFIEAVAKRWGMSVAKDFGEWRYLNQIAGYAKKFSYGSGTIDLLTVKGAGHLVPTDRPGPALQMFVNFLRNQDFSNPTPYVTDAASLTNTYVIAQKVGAANNANPSLEEESEVKKIAAPPTRRFMKKRAILKSQGRLLDHDHKRSKRAATASPPPPTAGSKDADQITNLPGLTFTPNFKQYSGYLAASAGNYLHYWLVESQNNPSTDPLILWLNGGPGCSSLGGFFEELGPFHVNQDGSTLFENVYSWNKAANVIFMEAPRDVGFSFRSNEVATDPMYNDTYTADDNVLALASFFDRFQEYKNRDFYITGESYGGVYVPTLTAALIKKIQDGAMSYVKLVGVGIGNGEMSEVQQINSAVSLLYWRGEHGKSDYDALSKCCNTTNKPQTYCDFVSYITLDTAGNAWPKYNDGSLAAQCGQLVVQQGFNDVWGTDNDVYNTFQDCYTTTDGSSNLNSRARRVKRSIQPLTNGKPFVDQGSLTNKWSTDANGGFACYNGDATQSYLNLKEVRQAIHIPDSVPYWTDCNDDMNEHYVQMHNDTTSVFQEILDSNYPLRFLIYNGDVDMACQFLGDEWFIESLAANNKMTATPRSSWNFTQAKQYHPKIGGYFKTFNYKNSQVTFDLLTVKGGGHFVPTDRPGPALQMVYNFVNKLDYNTGLSLNLNSQPLLPNYVTPPPQVNRREADRVFSLPGATFVPSFNQHSGYLSASNGNYLHYWLVESQGDVMNDPLILWLNGGPGCSSLGGMLTENGPFHPNPDGQTLFENVYSWNKGASVLYMESPRQVGFSYQDKNANNNQNWNDDMTTSDAILALKDFFATYPHFKNSDFYITGESYAGVYIPMLTRAVIKEIQDGNMPSNLQGIAIGNGMISSIQDIRSLPDFLYYHGIYGKQDWDALHACCPSFLDNNTALYCDFEYYVNIDQYGNVVAKTFQDPVNQNCARLVEQMSFDRNWMGGYDVYNLYQSCYAKTNGLYNPLTSKAMSKDFTSYDGRVHLRRQMAAQMSQLNVANPSQLDPLSTDNFGGFQCFMVDATQRYLSQSHVRDALHIPDFVQPFELCADLNYTLQYNDTTPIFDDILNSGYKLRVLIYNGDTDTACSMFEAEWMINDFARENGFFVQNKRSAWMYANNIAGYTQKFRSSDSKMDIYLTTVKGAGHMVPTDRPGPALQLITNFITKQDDFNTTIPYDLTRQPLLPQFTQTGDDVTTTTSPNGPTTPTTTATTTTTTLPKTTSTTTTTTTTMSTTTTTTTTTTPTTTTTTTPPANGNNNTTTTTTTTTTTSTVPPTTTSSSVVSALFAIVFTLMLF